MIANAVYVDLSPLAADGLNGGAKPMVLEVLAALQSGERPLELHLLVKRDVVPAVASLASRGAVVHLLGAEVPEPRRLRRTWRRQVETVARFVPDGASLRRRGASVLFSPLGTATFHEPGLRHVAVAYDFQDLDHPDFFTVEERRRRRAFHADLLRADAVVAISGFTRDEAVSRIGVARERVTVIPPQTFRLRRRLSDEDVDARLTRLGLTRDAFAVYPANFWPHKNHERLLQALALAPDVPLVLCGAIDEARTRLAARIRALGLGSRVTLLPYVEDEHVTALLQGARVLVFPSLYEGFGLPVAEAFALGTPVVCSDIPALNELAGDAAALFDPRSPDAISAVLRDLYANQARRDDLRARGARRAAELLSVDAARLYRELLSPTIARA